MIIFSHTITPRLRYITEFISKEIAGEPASISDDLNKYKNYSGTRINYSAERIATDELWIIPQGLLFENTISSQQIECFDWNGMKAFYKTGGDLPFDIFSASFYLISRYEEYLPHQKDSYGRYDHQQSLAWKENFLDQPLVNYWIQELKKILQQKFPTAPIHQSTFTFLPTYDIDMAWSYLHKGFGRNTAGVLRSFFTGRWKDMGERLRVLRKKQKDPFDSYGWMNQLHEKHKVRPYYFFLLAGQRSRYDKNIPPGSGAMKKLVHEHALHYPVGIHPSWRSGDEPSLLKKEIDALASVTGSQVRSSRQHYIRFTLPETFRQLIEQNIQFDFSMGYGSINGFRASVSSVFYWYDLEKEQQTSLALFPYCYMDANSLYEQKQTPGESFEEMRRYYRSVKAVNGTFIMIWHNTFLGTDPFFSGWRQVYEKFIEEAV